MDAVLYAVFADPMRYIGAFCALMGALGLLYFIAGFALGVVHLITYSQSAHHMAHAYERIVWGVLWCMVWLGMWEALRVVAGQAPPSYLIVAFILLSPLWVPWLRKKTKGGGGH